MLLIFRLLSYDSINEKKTIWVTSRVLRHNKWERKREGTRETEKKRKEKKRHKTYYLGTCYNKTMWSSAQLYSTITEKKNIYIMYDYNLVLFQYITRSNMFPQSSFTQSSLYTRIQKLYSELYTRTVFNINYTVKLFRRSTVKLHQLVPKYSGNSHLRVQWTALCFYKDGMWSSQACFETVRETNITSVIRE